MKLERINPDELFKLDAVSQVVKASGVSSYAFIAGQPALDRDMQLVGPGDLAAQTAQAARNLRTAVEAAGSTLENIVSSTVYVVNLDDAAMEAFGRGLAEGLGGKPLPPHGMTMIGVAALAMKGMLVEISAVAAVP